MGRIKNPEEENVKGETVTHGGVTTATLEKDAVSGLLHESVVKRP